MDFEEIGRQFVGTFYATFDANRGNLESLYAPNSMLTFEGSKFSGTEAIMKKLKELPFRSVTHVITTTDSQPTVGNGVVVFVIGQLKTDDDPPHSFSETFVLQPSPSGSFFVLNEMFRLSIHNIAGQT